MSDSALEADRGPRAREGVDRVRVEVEDTGPGVPERR